MREAHLAADIYQRHWGAPILAVSAGVLLALSVLMPQLHSETIALRANRVIDHWEGVALLGCAALLITGAFLTLRHRRWAWLVCTAGVTALGVAIYAGSGARLLLLPATPGVQGDVYAVPGFGLLVAGLAALVAIGAGLAVSLREHN